MRTLQRRLYHRVLSPRLDRSPYSHGGVPGRSVLTNVRQHIGQSFLFAADIADFYPSVHWTRVTRLFTGLRCSDEVARICTRICTYKNCLSQGLLTSPILADRLMRPVDDRIAAACEQAEAKYTRYVDDLAISAPFDLTASGIPLQICRILRLHGFAPNPDKFFFGPVDARASITNIRFHRGRPDVRKEYVEEVLRQLGDAASLAHRAVRRPLLHPRPAMGARAVHHLGQPEPGAGAAVPVWCNRVGQGRRGGQAPGVGAMPEEPPAKRVSQRV